MRWRGWWIPRIAPAAEAFATGAVGARPHRPHVAKDQQQTLEGLTLPGVKDANDACLWRTWQALRRETVFLTRSPFCYNSALSETPARTAEFPPHARDVHTVAPRYDFITRAFSYGMDRHWKRTWASTVPNFPDRPVVLDLAAGTGDFSLLVRRALPGSRAVAVDITERMLQLARERGLEHAVCGDAGVLPFPDALFDCVFVGYGLRNFPNLESRGAAKSNASPVPAAAGQPGFLPARPIPCCAHSTLLTSMRREHFGAWCSTAARAFTPTSPTRSALLSPSTISLHCLHRTGYRPCGCPALHFGRHRAALGS